MDKNRNQKVYNHYVPQFLLKNFSENDKSISMYIKDIIDNASEVALITRPRRFGKTLNMSMLRYFFDCDIKDSREIFDGLKIIHI